MTVSHSDLAGNGVSATATATRTDVVILTLTDPSDIDEDNEDSYSVSGTCSEDGEEIALSVGSVSPHSAPTCTSFTWEVTGLDVRSLANGVVIITAVHGDVTKTDPFRRTVFLMGEEMVRVHRPQSSFAPTRI